MRAASLFVTGVNVAMLSIALLLCGPSGTAISQTATPSGGAASLPSVVVGAPKHRTVADRTVSPRTMIASASSAPIYGRDIFATTTGNCSTTTDFTVSPVQCTKPVARNYVECTEMVRKNGSRASDAWWWCSNQGFRN